MSEAQTTIGIKSAGTRSPLIDEVDLVLFASKHHFHVIHYEIIPEQI